MTTPDPRAGALETVQALVDRAIPFEEHDRRTTLGASEAPATLGAQVSRFSSPHRIWMQKRGIVTDEVEGGHIDRGTFGEDLILREYSRRMPDVTCVPTSRLTVVHRDLPWASASPDMLAVWPAGVTALVEAKWPSSRMLEEWGDPEAESFEGPDRYRFQGVWQMAVTEIRTFVDFIIPWDIDSWDFRIYRLHYNRTAEEELMAAASDFWQRCVLQGDEPELDGSEDADDWIAHQYPAITSGGRSKDDKIDLRDDPDASDLAVEHKRLALQIDELDLRRKKIGQMLKAKIGDHYGAQLGGLAKSATYYDSSSTVTRWKDLVADLGIDEETVARYTTRKPFRVLKCSYVRDIKEALRGTKSGGTK